MALKQKKHIIAWIMRWTPDQAWYYYEQSGGFGRKNCSLLEPALAKDAHIAVTYAVYYKQARFKQAEELIAKEPYEAAFYAIKVLKRRWLKGEKAIFSDGICSAEYGKMLQKREGLHDEVRD